MLTFWLSSFEQILQNKGRCFRFEANERATAGCWFVEIDLFTFLDIYTRVRKHSKRLSNKGRDDCQLQGIFSLFSINDGTSFPVWGKKKFEMATFEDEWRISTYPSLKTKLKQTSRSCPRLSRAVAAECGNIKEILKNFSLALGGIGITSLFSVICINSFSRLYKFGSPLFLRLCGSYLPLFWITRH